MTESELILVGEALHMSHNWDEVRRPDEEGKVRAATLFLEELQERGLTVVKMVKG